ncbi:glycosyltransferase family 2 protein [Enterovibrio calviensis]|uniref:glycosyltransferase family 2 protein n=1 Tax=Enterovibrio calviensis TaxID=91359 RepID=UPI0037363492
MENVSVVILTYNEEKNIQYALDNINGWAREIIILDSYSTDETVAIAKQYEAKVHYRKFDDFSSQRKYALREIPIESDWIFVLDADEYLTEELKSEISYLLKNPQDAKDAYFINRRFYWQGKWLKRCFYPTTLLRFGKTGMIDCDDRPINEHMICKTDNVGQLKYDFIDCNRKDLNEWVLKHNSYATREAEQLAQKDTCQYKFFSSQYERKRWVRAKIWNRLPPVLRPFIYFIYRYFIQMGFLDGKEGFMYHFIDSFVYRSLIDFKYLENKWKNSND